MFAAIEALLNAVAKELGENGSAFFLAGFHAHVDDADEGHFLIVDAGGHFEEGVFAVAGVVVAFERGGGGTENDDGFFELAAHDGAVAGMVARAFLLFVGMLVLFVDDDQAEVIDGSEDGGAGADGDAGAFLADFLPFVVTLAGGEVAVQDGDEGFEFAGAEAGFETLDGLGREGDFGNKDDRAFAGFQRVRDGLEVDFGFAAAGHAVEEEVR